MSRGLHWQQHHQEGPLSQRGQNNTSQTMGPGLKPGEAPRAEGIASTSSETKLPLRISRKNAMCYGLSSPLLALKAQSWAWEHHRRSWQSKGMAIAAFQGQSPRCNGSLPSLPRCTRSKDQACLLPRERLKITHRPL